MDTPGCRTGGRVPQRACHSTLTSDLLAVRLLLLVVLVAPAPGAASTAADLAAAGLVIDATGLSASDWASAVELVPDMRAVEQACRAVGLRVADDPQGTCLAAARPLAPSDQYMEGDRIARITRLAGLVHRLTRDQLASPRMQSGKGLDLDSLSPLQRTTVLDIARQRDLLDDTGQPHTPGWEFRCHLWLDWVRHIAVKLPDGETLCLECDTSAPPSAPAVAASPLPGSVLWWAWPYAHADWGDAPVTIAPGLYTLEEVLQRLSAVSRQFTFMPDRYTYDRKLAVAAEKMPVRRLLWAIEVATGLPARIVPDAVPPEIAVAAWKNPLDCYHFSRCLLRPLPGFGYWSPADNDAVCERFRTVTEGLLDRTWVGWRLADLPLLFQEDVHRSWRSEYKHRLGKPPPGGLVPEETYVLWTKAASVELRVEKDGQGASCTYSLPALWEPAQPPARPHWVDQ